MGRELEEFVPHRERTCRALLLRPTVYNYAHIGNLRTYVFEDMLRRVLERNGYDVNHVMNVTDVGHLTDDADEGEDKMLVGARERGMSVWEIAEHFTQAFFADIGRLNVVSPGVVCRATEHIGDAALVRATRWKGTHLSGRRQRLLQHRRISAVRRACAARPAGTEAGARIEVDSAKKNPHDFRALVHAEQVRAPGDAVGLSVGPGVSGLAPRMLGDEHEVPRRAVRHPHRRRGPHQRAPHERNRSVGGRDRQEVGELLAARRVPRHAKRSDGKVRGQYQLRFPRSPSAGTTRSTIAISCSVRTIGRSSPSAGRRSTPPARRARRSPSSCATLARWSTTSPDAATDSLGDGEPGKARCGDRRGVRRRPERPAGARDAACLPERTPRCRRPSGSPSRSTRTGYSGSGCARQVTKRELELRPRSSRR